MLSPLCCSHLGSLGIDNMISKKETSGLVLLALGLFYLKDRNHDVNMDGTKDDTDKGLILFLGALAFFYFM